jgi:hypothetical protein
MILNHILYRRRFKGQTSELWTNIATIIGRKKQEKENQKVPKSRKVAKPCFSRAEKPEKVGWLKRRVQSHLTK